jgi:hypothetical protein
MAAPKFQFKWLTMEVWQGYFGVTSQESQRDSCLQTIAAPMFQFKWLTMDVWQGYLR